MRGALLVTGGSRGIGASTARLAARAGWSVGVNYRSDEEAARQVVAEIEGHGGRATATDMSSVLNENPKLLARIEATIPMHRIAEVDEIARPIVWLLSEEASFVSGAHLDASGGGFLV